jgi:hypothetical protein
MAKEAARVAAEETEKITRRQMETMEKLNSSLHAPRPKGNGGNHSAGKR